MLSYPTAIPLSTRTLNHLAGLIRRHRDQRRSRWRRLGLRAIEYRLRNRFVAENPGWQRASLRRRVTWQVQQATDEAAMHRKKAGAADAVAARLLAELERL